MKYLKDGDKIFLRLDKGDEITESLCNVAKAENLTAASVTGIGATDDFTVGVLDLNKKEYEGYSFTGNHEINALTGNITTKDGKPYVHLHITCAGKGCKIVGGHLIKAVISVTGEIVIDTSSRKIERVKDDNVGINIWNI